MQPSSENPGAPNTASILVIDDEEAVRQLLEVTLADMGYAVTSAADGARALAACDDDDFDVALVDLRLPGMDGIELTRRLISGDADIAVVVMTGYSSIDSAVQAMKAGAADYLTKPLDLDHLELVLDKVLGERRRAEEIGVLRDQLEKQGSFEGLIGVSQEMQRVYRLIRRLGDSDVTVLVQGETGTGKELVSRAIHTRGARADRMFMPINCGALSENLLESELFGHEKGAFSGAIRLKRGLIEEASGGTLFLDEVEEMSTALQVKLLRTLQDRVVVRVGGTEPVEVDFRLITASNADLRERMNLDTFRSDLFYRVSGVVVDLPPLRQRQNDIPLLVRHFAAHYADRGGKPVRDFTSEAMMLLRAHTWPGNVRELQHAVEQAVLLSDGDAVTIADLPEHLTQPGEVTGDTDLHDLPYREARDRFERRYFEEVLDRAGGTVAEAARRAGTTRQYVYEKMKRYDIAPPSASTLGGE